MSLLFYIAIGSIGLLLIAIAVIWYRGGRYRSLQDAATALAESVGSMEAEFKNLSAAVSELREQNEAPLIKRTGGDAPQATDSKRPDDPSLAGWSRWFHVVTSRLDHSGKTRATLAQLKLRTKQLERMIQGEIAVIRQIAMYQAAREHARANVVDVRQSKSPKVRAVSDVNSNAHFLDHSDGLREEAAYESSRFSDVKITSRVPSTQNWADTHADLLQLYNRAVTDNQAREEFQERYKPIRLGTVNAVERRQNPTAAPAPEFKETTHGEFFAVPLQAESNYAVMPRLGLTIGTVSYNAGALGEIFSNPEYDPAKSYSRYCVRKPAVFKRESDHWAKLEPGNLELGPPD